MTFKGKDYLDIREHYQDSNGDWMPTKKGVAIPIELMPQIVTLVEQAEVEHASRNQA